MSTPTVAADQPANSIQIETEALTISSKCKAVRIVDQLTYDEAVELRVTLKNFITKAEAWFEPVRKKLYEAYNTHMSQKKSVLEPAERNLKILDGAITGWTREQQRLEDERRRHAEIEQRRIEEMERQSRAVDAIDNGADDESVQNILSEPIALAPVRVEPTYEKSSAIATVDNYKATIIDLKKFVKYVAKECDKNRGLLELLVGLKAVQGGYESPGLNKTAKAQKQSLTIPGVKVYNDSFVKSNSRR